MTSREPADPTGPAVPAEPAGSTVLSLRLDRELFERLRKHAAKRGTSVQDYVIRTLVRDDFDERFQTAVEETDRFYGRT
ncbi:ribbon-helix-helix protein, CopG family [Streptomyces sp. N2-109]|uniref:Ribbon-helix-helix protein, CopG family n=1 Tax=Streptomyces gossypii TaxID=2883101 RepID=A0ABT2JZP5_9ACTN|nr:ribbon-helix-helix protein, CopG family [Streptomyces gossypii]MCT2592704.1 ribbon-helix-helix protein, CopG family [Streptomyces gossypii]